MSKTAGTVALAILIGLGSASVVQAAGICDRLGFALATLSSRPDPTAEARKYARAIVEQKKGLRELGRTMRRQRCTGGSVVIIGDEIETNCAALEAKQSRMERNLEILEAKRISLLSNDATGLERQRLTSALSENGCADEPVLVSTPGEDGARPLVTDSDGIETIRIPATEPDYGQSQFVDLGGTSNNGTLRTMCVRTCDGGYFPVSSRASTLDFRRDAQVCSMMCPGVQTELFFHSIYQESSEMRSAASGRPYEALDSAFRFRTTMPGSKGECSCNFSLYHKEMQRRTSYVKDPSSVPERQSSIVWVKPELRGGLKKPVTDIPATGQRAARDYEPDRQIRVIGPKFLPERPMDFSRPMPDDSTAGAVN